VFDDLLASAGTTLADAVDLVRLDPVCRYSWPDAAPGGAATFDHRAGRRRRVQAVDEAFPGQGGRFDRWLDHARRIWEVADRSFFAGPLESPLALARRMQRPGDLLAIDPLRSLAGRAGTIFDDARSRAVGRRYATYSGSSPASHLRPSPASPGSSRRSVAWYVRGGLAVLADAWQGAGGGSGRVTGAEVTASTTRPVRGVRLAGGGGARRDVVSPTSTPPTSTRPPLPTARRCGALPGAALVVGFALPLGVESRRRGVDGHHEITSRRRPPSSADLRRGRAPLDPTIYLCNTSATDPSAAPAGCASWFVLVNVPPSGSVDWDGQADRYRDHLLDRLAARGFDVAGRMRVCEVVTPLDIAAATRSWQGSIYGTSSNGRRAAFLRPANRGPRRGLYLAGGSSHPGGGLPLVAMSGRIVADMVTADGWRP
jgi:phytoene dehydrogenase-like protein